MTTYISNAKASSNKEIIAAAINNGYRFNNVKAVCPKCDTARYSALKFNKGSETIYACPCGYRRKDVQDGNKVVVDKTLAPATKAKKPRKTSGKSKAKEMVNPGMPITM